MKKQDIFTLSIILITLVLVRPIFNIPNFNPIGAVALMGGFLFRNKRMAFVITLGALFVGDILMGLSSPIYMDYMFSATFLLVYLSFGMIILIGSSMKNKISLLKVVVGSLVSAVLFFLLTNAGSWMTLGYEKSLNGLLLAYEAGVPFFRASLVSQLVFSIGIYIVYNLATNKKTVLA